MDRIAQLRQFIATKPEQPFPRYALALELKGKGDAPGALLELEQLVRAAPDYLAAYLQLGMLLQEAGRLDDARAALQAGRELAQKKGDGHTLSELTSALEQLG